MKPLQLETIDREVMAFRNSLLCPRREIGFAVQDERFLLTFANEDHCRAPVLSFAIEGCQLDPIWISLTDTKLFEGCVEWLDENHLEDLPEEFASTLLDSTLGELLESLSSKFGDDLEITTVEIGTSLPATENTIPFELSSSAARTFGSIHCSKEWCSRIQKALATINHSASNDINALEIVELIDLGSAKLRIDELTSVEPGDVVLFDESDLLEDGCVTAQFGQTGQLRLQVDDSDLVFDRWSPFTQSHCQQGDEVPPTVAGDLRVDLQASCGRVNISLSELSTLEEGTPIRSCGTNAKTVELKSSNQTVGTGELIQIDEQLGVRIVEFSSNRLQQLLAPAAT
ncbi:FliM/FliN family flagellar motor switch protein [Thalassoglobus sp. JC818]|uniref:FliM/FliN family flagellar motor switch protein n=1 Tax=Thalassoglobus sp. JC818 TaxID=3232136 RepID=UPI003457C9D5